MKSLLSLLLAVLLAGCASQPVPAVSAQAPPPEPVPSSSAPEEPDAPAEIPLSARLAGREAGAAAVDWELEVTDPEELKELMDVLSPDGLTPIRPGEASAMIPDGGSPVNIELRYAGTTVSGYSFAQEWYRKSEAKRS